MTLATWQCRCGLVLLHPVPRPEQLPGAGDWHAPGRPERRRRAWLKRYTEPALHAIFGNETERFIDATRQVVPGGRLLDIGCGRGALLTTASAHYACEGLDPSVSAAAVARASGHVVMTTPLEEARLAPGHYDVITLEAVVEHLVDPVTALRRLRNALKPGGVIALTTPRLGGPSSRIYGREWNGYRVGYHLHLFSSATLTRALEAADYTVLRRPRRDSPLDDILSLWGRR